MMDPLIKVGKVVKTHGLDGFLKLNLDSGSSDWLEPGLILFIGKTENSSELVTIQELKPMPDAVLVKFREHQSVNSVKAFISLSVFMTESDFEKLDIQQEDSLLVGYQLKNVKSGKIVGTVIKTWESAAHPILVLAGTGGGETMVPFVEDWLIGISKRKKLIEMTLPEGLVD